MAETHHCGCDWVARRYTLFAQRGFLFNFHISRLLSNKHHFQITTRTIVISDSSIEALIEIVQREKRPEFGSPDP